MLNAVDMMYLNIMSRMKLAKETVKNRVREFWEEEQGSTSTIVVEIVMVGMILVLAFVFRKQIGSLFSSLWNSLVNFGESSGEPSIESMSNPFEK